MSRERIPVRTIKEVLRLKWSCGMSRRAISKSCGIARSTVDEYTKRARQSGLSWPLPEEQDDTALENLLYPLAIVLDSPRPLPIWVYIHRELDARALPGCFSGTNTKRSIPRAISTASSVTSTALTQKLDISMCQVHHAGEKLFVDYCGQTVPLIENPLVKYTTARSSWPFWVRAVHLWRGDAYAGLSDWIGSHVRALEFIGGVPEILVPDNLLSGISKACRYEPGVNRTYQELAVHYGAAVIPARVRKPKDKAKVEAGVQLVQRWILAALRNRTFFSLAELNAAIRELLDKLNNPPFKKLSAAA